MKKTISLFLSIIMLFSLTITGCAADKTNTDTNSSEIILQINNPNMTVNGTEKPIDGDGTVPVIVNDRTLLPVRAVAEEMGGTVQWDGSTKTVTLNYEEYEIKLIIDDNTAYLNGAAQILDTAPTIINERTMLPIRFIAESFKFNVNWNSEEQKITITKITQPSETAVPSAPPVSDRSDRLVLYFSATGTTKALAEKVAETANADIYEIIPKIPYTSEDLNYNNDCRANSEQQDDNSRPEFEPVSVNIDDYDTIFIGYPIWWGTMPKIINTLLETYDLSGKTIMPFCTSGGSGIEASVSSIRNICPNADVKDGMRGSASTPNSQITEWLKNSNF